MTKIKLQIEHGRNSGKTAGHFDTETKTFSKVITFKKHFFIQPKFRNFIFNSDSILKKLKELNCRTMKFLVVGLEERAFYLVIDFNVYMQNAVEKIEFEHDFQLGVHFNHFSRIYPMEQEVLV